MLDEIFKLMRIICTKTEKPVRLELWSDGSGELQHREVLRGFGNIEYLLFILKHLDEKGFMP